MSLLHRWSLPSRGLIRDRSQDDEPSVQPKFPTIHIGQPVPRRRTNLSSAFSTLFEKPENRRRTQKSENHSEATDYLQLLTPRRRDLPLDTDPKYSLTHEDQDVTTPEIGLPQRDCKPETATGHAEGETIKPQHCPGPEPPSRVVRKINETPNIRSFSLSSTETNDGVDRDEPLLILKTNRDCVRVRSASSSYPSEGMRSPASGPCSPKLVAATPTKDLFVEYRHYGRYPSRSSWFPTSAPMSKVSVADIAARENIPPPPPPPPPPPTTTTTTTARDGAASEHEAVVGQNSNFELSPFADPSESHEDSTSSDTQSQRGSGVIQGGDQQRALSSHSRLTPSILGIESALYFHPDSSSREDEGPGAQSTPSRDHDAQLEGINVGSMDHLRVSTDTDSTMLTTVRRSNISDSDDSWSTIQDSGEKPISRRPSWTQLFTLATSNGSSTTLAQRIRGLKLRTWAKRVVFKTKARFKLVGRPVPTTRRASGLRQQRMMWRPGKREVNTTTTTAAAAAAADHEYRKEKNKNKKKKKKTKTKRDHHHHWSAAKTLEVAKKRARQHKKAADHIFDTLSKRASLQGFRLPAGPSSVKPTRKLTRHKRVESSCPSDV